MHYEKKRKVYMEEVIKVEGMKEYEDWKIDEDGGNRVKEYGERNIYI